MSWWSVYEYAQPFLRIVGSWPTVGTPEWCALEGGPVKLAALYEAAQHWALRLETCQEQRIEASRAIAGPHRISCATWGPEEEGEITAKRRHPDLLGH
ncbi:hypothetical protein BST20_22395 [Mycobacterium branderi]|uniref:DUF2742 domain-containing protein n=1 Tax=Mycobacterium branderi TaxID=43348 RepID=A0AA91LTL4_9MYCO|nr:hypothetical protein BST20_22395 [Mycobacterium branderi]